MVLRRNRWEPARDRSLAHGRALAPAEVTLPPTKGLQTTRPGVIRCFHTGPTADHATKAGTRVSAARRCPPGTCQQRGCVTACGAWASAPSRPGCHCAPPRTTSSTVSKIDYLLRSFCMNNGAKSSELFDGVMRSSQTPGPSGRTLDVIHLGAQRMRGIRESRLLRQARP